MKHYAFIIPDEIGPLNKWLLESLQKHGKVDVVRSPADLKHDYQGALLRLFSKNGAQIGSHFDPHPAVQAAQKLLQKDIKIANGPIVQNIVEDKLICGHLLALAGLPVMPGWDYFHAKDQKEYADGWIVKPNRGSMSRDISYVKTLPEALQLAQIANEQMIIQHFLPDAICVRVVSSGDQVFTSYAKEMLDKTAHVAAISLGGRRVDFDPAQANVGRIAMQATKLVGASLLGVDILVSRDGIPYILELNANPGGLMEFEQEVKDQMIEHFIKEMQ